MVQIYFVEGSIGAGKSTFLKMIEKHFPQTCQVIYEPVDLWTTLADSEGKNILDLFYRDMQRYAYTFQSFAFISRAQTIKQIDTSKRFIFIERSIWSDKNIFAKNCFESGLMSEMEFKLYNMWFEWIEQMVLEEIEKVCEVPKFVYMRATPETCQTRIGIRSREEEKDVKIDYLQGIHQRHEDWLIPVRTLNDDDDEIAEALTPWFSDDVITIDVDRIDIHDPKTFLGVVHEKSLLSNPFATTPEMVANALSFLGKFFS